MKRWMEKLRNRLSKISSCLLKDNNSNNSSNNINNNINNSNINSIRYTIRNRSIIVTILTILTIVRMWYSRIIGLISTDLTRTSQNTCNKMNHNTNSLNYPTMTAYPPMLTNSTTWKTSTPNATKTRPKTNYTSKSKTIATPTSL